MKMIPHLILLVSLFILPLNSATAKGKEGVYAQLLKTCQEMDTGLRSSTSIGTQRIIVAVIEVADQGKALTDIEFGKGFAEMLGNQMAKVANVTVVNRKRTESALKEMELSASGLADAGNALQLGKLLAADYLVSGTAGQMGANIVINLNVTETESSKIVASASVTLPAATVLPMAQATSAENKFPATAAFRSFSVPGWGMFYNDKPGWGAFYSTATFLGLATSVIFTVSSKIADRNYKAINAENFNTYEPDARTVTEAAVMASDWRYGNEVARTVSWSVTGGLWLFGMLHAGIAARRINKNIKQYTKAGSAPNWALALAPTSDGGRLLATCEF